MSTPAAPTDPAAAAAMAAALERANYFIFVTQIYFCAMYAIVVWDWITSIKKEMRFIWAMKWNPIKILYFFCRYWVLIIMPIVLWLFCAKHSRSFCNRAYNVGPGLAMWNQAAAEGILLVRTYAFFGRNKLVLATLVPCLAGVLIYQLFVDIARMAPLPFFDGDTGFCFPMSLPGQAHLLGYFVAPLAFDTIVTVMTLAKAIHMRRANGPSSQIIQVFLREGIFYYMLISVANLINGIFYFQPEADMSAIMIPLSVMLAPILACRLVLDIRQRAEERSIVVSSLNARRTPPFGVAVNSNTGGHSDPGANHGSGIVSIGRADTAIELQTVGSKDYKDDIGEYRSVEVPMNPKGIRVDVEKGMAVR